MLRHMMKSKIHTATVTEANLNYVGSITIDEDILEAVNILPHEKVQVVNNNNGARLETYVIAGERGSKTICLNGAAARHVQKGDVVIIIAYAMVEESELANFIPKVALMNSDNSINKMLEQEAPFTSYEPK